MWERWEGGGDVYRKVEAGHASNAQFRIADLTTNQERRKGRTTAFHLPRQGTLGWKDNRRYPVVGSTLRRHLR